MIWLLKFPTLRQQQNQLNKKENMFNFMLSCLALCNPRCAGMVVPGAGNLLEAFQPWNS